MTAFEIKTNRSDYPYLVIADSFKKAIEQLYAKEIYDSNIISVNQLEVYKSDHILIDGTKPSEEESAGSIQEDYQGLREEVETWRGVRYKDRGYVADALMNENAYLSLEKAKSFSAFYGQITKEIIREALVNGEIEGHVPTMQTVEYERWSGNSKYPATREQPVGKYEILVKSLVMWLEKNYKRQASKDSLVNKYLTKIVNA